MTNKISCCVKNCVYNNCETNACQAPTVSVGPCISSFNTTTSSETMCSTFVPKN